MTCIVIPKKGNGWDFWDGTKMSKKMCVFKVKSMCTNFFKMLLAKVESKMMHE
jgi:hypothetical protein